VRHHSAMRLTYDPVADAAYIYLTEIRPGDVAAHSVVDRMMDRASVILEFDQENRLIGIELLGASRVLPQELLEAGEKP
jgi:uncharacterized protein YuzE